MLQDVLDLDGDVEGHARVRGVDRARHRQRVLGAVEEVGIAERDVARAGRHLRADVGDDDVDGHDEEAAAVDRRDRAVAAVVQAAAAGLDVAGDARRRRRSRARA